MTTEKIASVLVKAFQVLSFDPNKIYNKANNHTVSEWRHIQEGLAGAAGTGAAIVPGLHIPALGVDIGYLINRMDECCYGIGAIVGMQSGLGNILEKEDLANILALWCNAITIAQLDRVQYENRENKLGTKLTQPALGKVGAVSLGVLGATSNRLTLKVATKMAAKLGAKITTKTAAGFIPLAGALASGGINVWLVSSVSNAAEKYYSWKAGCFFDWNLSTR